MQITYLADDPGEQEQGRDQAEWNKKSQYKNVLPSSSLLLQLRLNPSENF